MRIREIVKEAFEVDELVHQFTEIDVEDNYLKTGSVEEVNEAYSDNDILEEAHHRLSIALDPYNQEEECWVRDAKQLKKFISRWDFKQNE